MAFLKVDWRQWAPEWPVNPLVAQPPGPLLTANLYGKVTMRRAALTTGLWGEVRTMAQRSEIPRTPMDGLTAACAGCFPALLKSPMLAGKG